MWHDDVDHEGATAARQLAMEPENDVLQQAIAVVDQERAYLREELAAFDEFRESVRLAGPEPMTDTAHSETTDDLKEVYREVVLDRLEHDAIYGDSLAESLEQELSPSIANALTSNKPLTQRRKRNLLVETTVAIERREKFLAEIDEERAALERSTDELSDIELAIESLPECSPQEQLLEELLEVWDAYDALKEHCERLLERRQEQVRKAERSVRVFGDQHAFYDYLYGGLESSYPVLSALADTLHRINSKKTGHSAQKSAEWPMTY